MTPEQKARVSIDALLVQAGWHVCSVADANIHASTGVAIREFPLNSGFGFADYLLYVNDEAHRSIHNLWRQVLECIDAYLIGLTATPNKQTFGFFNQNLVMEYGHARAVADGVNGNYDLCRFKRFSDEVEVNRNLARAVQVGHLFLQQSFVR